MFMSDRQAMADGERGSRADISDTQWRGMRDGENNFSQRTAEECGQAGKK